MDYYEIGDTIHGSKIYVEARKIEGYRVIVKTGKLYSWQRDIF